MPTVDGPPTLTARAEEGAYVAVMDVAWGCKPHSGWAVAVLVAGSAREPVVLDRRRLQLCPDHLPRQVYHAAQDLPRPGAAALVATVHAAVATMAADAVGELTARALDLGDLIAVAVVGRPREIPDLDAVLASHARLHAAEGELYRGALDEAADARGLAVVTAPTKGTVSEAAASIGTSEDALASRLTALRAELGAPWQADHKDAAAAGLMALHLRR